MNWEKPAAASNCGNARRCRRHVVAKRDNDGRTTAAPGSGDGELNDMSQLKGLVRLLGHLAARQWCHRRVTRDEDEFDK